ncbi:MAG: hypothetical protein ACTSWU_00895 [Candidatus Thorarchaeota archaeon]
MAKRFDWELVKRATVDSGDETATEVRGTWYKNQRYFSHSIFQIRVEGTIAIVEYFKGNIDFKRGGKAYYGFKNSGTRGDLHCPTIHEIGNTPVIVVEEVFRDSGGWNSQVYSELIIWSYNGGYAQFDGVYTVKGATFLLNRMLYEMGFEGEKTSDGYVWKKFTPEEEAEISKKEAEERNLYRLTKKKETEEEKARKWDEFVQAHKDGTLRLVIQTGDGYSPITGIRIPEKPKGTDYVFAWFVEGGEVTGKQACYYRNHKLTKKHLKEIDIEVQKSVNRWSIWFHAVDRDAVRPIAFLIDYTEYMAAWR